MRVPPIVDWLLRKPAFGTGRTAFPDSLDSAVVRPVQSATLRSLFLVDPVLFADATNGAAKLDANGAAVI